MPNPHRPRNRENHEMVRARGVWTCTARNPRCGFVARTDAEMLEHVTAQQADLRSLAPVPLPGDPDDDVAAA